MPSSRVDAVDGGCACGDIRYRLHRAPLVVHCCHCRRCQRESGAAFALNALVESAELKTIGGITDLVDTPSASGAGQKMRRCPRCRVALWSY